MSHRNARLTLHGRRILVDRVCSGRPIAHVAKEMGISRPTAYKWARRWRGEGEAGLYDPLLSPLRSTARWSTATVGPDIHIKVGRTLYSVPWKLIGRKVDVRATATMVQIFRDGELVKTHAALEQGRRTDKHDYSPEKIAFQMRTPVWCRAQASEAGDSCREVIDHLLEVNVLYRLRASQGVLGLRKKFGDTRLEAAWSAGSAIVHRIPRLRR